MTGIQQQIPDWKRRAWQRGLQKSENPGMG